MTEEQKDTKERAVGGSEIIKLHLSDVFKTKPDPINKVSILNGILEYGKKIIGDKKAILKIKLNGSYCQFFRISPNTYKQEDMDGGGTLNEKGVLNFL